MSLDIFRDACCSLLCELTSVNASLSHLAANYKHSILGDPIPGASEPGTCASPNASQLFLRNLEPKPENSSALFFHPTLDQKNDSGLEDDFSGSSQLVHEFARKVTHQGSQPPPHQPQDRDLFLSVPAS